MIVQRFNLNLIPNQSPVIVHVNQYDTGTGRLIATLYEGNEPYSPNGTAVIQGTKPDGHGFQYTATLDGNVVTADLTEQMSPVAGDVRAQIVVTESSGETGTFVFIMRVQPSALPSDADMSESDYPLIEEAIREAQEAVERAEAAITETQENAENSEAWAQGTRGGIPVGPTDPTYGHNAEYWAQYAERYAQGGLHYKASIPFANIPTTGMREGDMYDITDDFTTDSRFTEGAGIKVKGGTNIAWNSDNKWDILALPYIPKTTFNGRSGSILPMAGDYDSKMILLSSALHIGGETQNDVQKALEALEGNKADRVDNAIADNFAGLDANGNLKDSGKNAGDFATPSDIESVEVMYEEEIYGVNLLPRFTLADLKAINVNGTWNNNVYTRNGITFTVDENTQTVSISSGTSTAYTNFRFNINLKELLKRDIPYTVNGMSNSIGRLFIYDRGAGGVLSENHGGDSSFVIPSNRTFTNNIELIFDVNQNVTIQATTIRPMIRKAYIEDSTYRPYNPQAIQNQLNAQGVLGAKNLLPNTGTSQTINGITFTVNDDGSVTANGTATAPAIFWVTGSNNNKYTFDKDVIISGCPSGGSGSTYALGGTNVGVVTDEAVITAGNAISVACVIYSGVTVSNIVFKPMLRVASDPDDTYQPYAMTNRELTEKKINIADLKTVVSSSSDFTDFKTRIASL